MDISPSPRVFLVGGGPGDPGLLTLRAVECLRLADVVLYDQLISRRILEHVRPGAECLCVNELPGEHPQRWPYIHRKLIEDAQAGKIVVRLKGGDPLIFGRAGEEAEALRGAGIPYEIVPGVTAALAAGATMDIPLTHRQHASALALITGHENPTKETTRLDWAALARFPGTLAIYMAIARLPLIIQELIRHGVDPNTPSAIVHLASTGQQVSVLSPLAELEEVRRRHGIDTPSIVLVGSVVQLRPERSWFEQRPLVGRRVLLTRPVDQVAELSRRLELLGAVPFHLPVIQLSPPANWTEVDRALDRLRQGQFDWLVFTSVNGVKYFLGRLRQRGRDLRDLARVKLAVIGPATAEALRGFHLEPDLVPVQGFRSEVLAVLLKEQAAGQRVLLARADRGRELLREEVGTVATVEQVVAYQQRDAVDSDAEIFDHVRRGEVDFVTFTSSNIARAFLRQVDDTIRGRILQGRTRLVTISSVTSAAVKELGFPVHGEAIVETTEGIVEELIRLAQAEATHPVSDQGSGH